MNNRGEGNDSSTHLIFSTRITINACRVKAAQVFLLIVSILCSLSDFHHVKIFLSSLTEFTQWKHFTFFYWMQRKKTRFSRVAFVEWGDTAATPEFVFKFCREIFFLFSFKLLGIFKATFSKDLKTHTFFNETQTIPTISRWLLSLCNVATLLAIRPLRRSNAFKAIYVYERYYLCFVLIPSWQTLNSVRQRKPNLEQSGKLIFHTKHSTFSLSTDVRTLWFSCRT